VLTTASRTWIDMGSFDSKTLSLTTDIYCYDDSISTLYILQQYLY